MNAKSLTWLLIGFILGFALMWAIEWEYHHRPLTDQEIDEVCWDYWYPDNWRDPEGPVEEALLQDPLRRDI